MLPNVLLIVKISSSCHFYYLCIWLFQLVSVLVLLILEFHTCPLVVLLRSVNSRVFKDISFYCFFLIGNILVHWSSWTHRLFFCLFTVTLDRSTVPVLPQFHQSPDTRGAPYRQNVRLTGFLLPSLLLLKMSIVCQSLSSVFFWTKKCAFCILCT